MKKEATILLQTRQLSIGYREPLLTDLSLQIKSGELVCFMGPNGIGKSTLIRTLAGLQKPMVGSVEGIEASETQIASPKQIAVVLTDRVNAVNMNVRELVSFGRYPYLNWNIQLSENDHEIIRHSLEQVNITHLADKKIHELSDGQLQMVMIARALAQDTPLILLDEPTAHLDLNNRVEIMKLLRTLAHKFNKAVLISTHELDLALQMADVIWITGKEKNVITGIPEDLVLNGTFDDVFQFKGFDLKTGKVQHLIHQNRTIELTGEGYDYLWTKNALERNGFELKSDNNSIKITVQKEGVNTRWKVGSSKSFLSLEELLCFLIEN